MIVWTRSRRSSLVAQGNREAEISVLSSFDPLIIVYRNPSRLFIIFICMAIFYQSDTSFQCFLPFFLCSLYISVRPQSILLCQLYSLSSFSSLSRSKHMYISRSQSLCFSVVRWHVNTFLLVEPGEGNWCLTGGKCCVCLPLVLFYFRLISIAADDQETTLNVLTQIVPLIEDVSFL